MDIETSLVGKSQNDELAAIQSALNTGFDLTVSPSGAFSIEASGMQTTVQNVDAAVSSFLAGFSREPSTVAACGGRLRVAVYVDESDDFAFFGLDISLTSIRRLAELSLGLEVNFYPCSDESDSD